MSLLLWSLFIADGYDEAIVDSAVRGVNPLDAIFDNNETSALFDSRKGNADTMSRETVVVRGKSGPIRATIKDRNGVKDLTGAELIELVMKSDDGTVYRYECTILGDATLGRVELELNDISDEELAPEGRYRAEFEITFPSETAPQIFPSRKPNSIVLRQPLDP